MKSNDVYKKTVDIFGEKLINAAFPELGLSDALVSLSAVLQRVCEILVLKKIITKEEYLELFSDNEMKKMKERLLKEAEKGDK